MLSDVPICAHKKILLVPTSEEVYLLRYIKKEEDYLLRYIKKEEDYLLRYIKREEDTFGKIYLELRNNICKTISVKIYLVLRTYICQDILGIKSIYLIRYSGEYSKTQDNLDHHQQEFNQL